jgi:ATP-dependent DNA helicase RecQ
LLINPSDVLHAEAQFLSVLPDKSFLNLVFVKLCTFFQIAYGEGIDEQFTFNLNQFCSKYNFPILKTYNALQFLDRQGVLTLSQEFTEKVSVQFIIPSKEVIRYMSLNPNDENIMLTMLRTYPGVYDMQTAFNTTLIAKKSNSNEKEVLSLLEKLKGKQVIELIATKNDAMITFNEVREDERTVNRVSKHLLAQNKLKTEQLHAVLYYGKENKTCKNKVLMRYFGETIKEGGRDLTIIELAPKDKKKNYFKIKLFVEKNNQQIIKTIVYDKNGSVHTYSITNQIPNIKFEDNYFTFDAKKYPNVEINDMR